MCKGQLTFGARSISHIIFESPRLVIMSRSAAGLLILSLSVMIPWLAVLLHPTTPPQDSETLLQHISRFLGGPSLAHTWPGSWSHVPRGFDFLVGVAVGMLLISGALIVPLP